MYKVGNINNINAEYLLYKKKNEIMQKKRKEVRKELDVLIFEDVLTDKLKEFIHK